jgi:glycosyltransferase involved in cell wall biosynthesis
MFEKLFNYSRVELESIFPLNHYVQFADDCIQSINPSEKCIVFGHGVETLPALAGLKKNYNCKIICDVIEIPYYDQRSVPRQWNPTVINILNSANESMLSQCDSLITVSHAMGKLIHKFNDDTHVIENFLNYRDLVPSDSLRREFKLRQSDKIILCSNLISTGFSDIVDVLKYLPDDYHLVTLGNFLPHSYKSDCIKYVNHNSLQNRVHFHERVSYDKLHSMIADSELGIIVLSKDNANHRHSLPNRIFDYVFSEVPFLSPPIGDIEKIVFEFQIGDFLSDSAETNAKKVLELIANREHYVSQIKNAKPQLSWNKHNSKISQIFSGAETVFFIGTENILKNPRKNRFHETLSNQGKNIKYFWIT